VRKIIILFISISIFSCQKKEFESKLKINLDFKNGEINKFFNGNVYHKLKGLKHKDSSATYEFINTNGFIELNTKNVFLNKFKNVFLIDYLLKFSLHDLSYIESFPVELKFNSHLSKETYFMPNITLENLEVLKNRSSKIFRLSENLTLTEIYNSLPNSELPNFENIIFHNGSKVNLNILKKNELYPN
jgi:hypothetical protein